MDVLQASFAVTGGTESEKGFEGIIPDAGNIGDFQFRGNEGALQFEAKQDVEIVGCFVGLHANGGVSGAIDGGEKLIEINVAEMWKEFLGPGKPAFPERAGAADVVFPQAGLRFVNAKRDSLTRGEVKVVGGKTLLVETMAGFVHYSE